MNLSLIVGHFSSSAEVTNNHWSRDPVRFTQLNLDFSKSSSFFWEGRFQRKLMFPLWFKLWLSLSSFFSSISEIFSSCQCCCSAHTHHTQCVGHRVLCVGTKNSSSQDIILSNHINNIYINKDVWSMLIDISNVNLTNVLQKRWMSSATSHWSVLLSFNLKLGSHLCLNTASERHQEFGRKREKDEIMG